VTPEERRQGVPANAERRHGVPANAERRHGVPAHAERRHGVPAHAQRLRGVPFDSVSRRINAERIVLLGWGRAILLQLAHPLIAAGVYEHSGFRSTTWAAVTRLYHTVHAMLALTFGSDAERERALDGIRQIHQRVHGQLKTGTRRFPDGTPYSAEDPDLVLWVHATLLESVPMAYERFVGPLTLADRDAYCADAAPIAVALMARSDEVPRTWAEARAYLDRMYASGTLEVTEQARTLARAVLSPPAAAKWIAGPATWTNRIVTLGLLPPLIRRQYRFDWSPLNQRTFNVLVPTLRSMRRVLPGAVTRWPEARVPASPGIHLPNELSQR
jgi:uncharacterized protein (DUF2236 family)